MGPRGIRYQRPQKRRSKYEKKRKEDRQKEKVRNSYGNEGGRLEKKEGRESKVGNKEGKERGSNRVIVVQVKYRLHS